jgi:site-specific DNA-adenine methylase
MRYPGGKNNNGSWQQIISEIPLHSVYIELFAGSAAVFRNKLPAERSYLIDRDVSLLPAETPGVCVVEDDVMNFLYQYDFTGSEFIYADPPYMFSVRRSRDAGIYKFEFGLASMHRALLLRLCELTCKIAISGYWSELYETMLPGWRVKRWTVGTRRGIAEELLWMNYPVPALLQDGRFVGANYIQRQRFRRLAGVEKR